MTLNLLGLIAAASAFLGIWLGHVGVRAIEQRAAHLGAPVAAAALLGVLLEIGALLSESRLWSAAGGVLGMIALWSALEFIRQEKRVRRGHAPANPHNPRHARILARYPAASTQNPFAGLLEDER